VEILIHNQREKEIPENKTTLTLINNIVSEVELEAESLDVIFVDDAALKNMHEEYLDDPTLTDVITFDLGEDSVEGELYISLDRAQDQASTYNVPYFTEINRLIIHGILHLKGYDDLTDELRKEMKMVENRLVEKYS
jgi:rRNA maturation RNase YbeY